MAKKKNKIAKFRARRQNPDGGSGPVAIAIGAGTGFAGYAATRLLSRIVYAWVLRRFPRLAGHARAGAGIVGALATYVVTKYWSRVSEHHESTSIGAGVAALQGLLQTYVPKFGWVVSDVAPEQYTVAKRAEQSEEPVFSLESLLAENPDVEAVEIPQDALVVSPEEDEDEDRDEDVVWGIPEDEMPQIGMFN